MPVFQAMASLDKEKNEAEDNNKRAAVHAAKSIKGALTFETLKKQRDNEFLQETDKIYKEEADKFKAEIIKALKEQGEEVNCCSAANDKIDQRIKNHFTNRYSQVYDDISQRLGLNSDFYAREWRIRARAYEQVYPCDCCVIL